MKRSVEVIKTVEYDIEIDDSILNQEFVDSFESGFWELDGDTLEEKIDGLFKVVAHQLINGEDRFIEGVGRCASVRTVDLYRKDGDTIPVVWEDVDEYIETEVQ